MVIVFLLLSSIYVLVLYPADIQALELTAATGSRTGEITYQIGGKFTTVTGQSGNVRFPLSELRFILKTPVVHFNIKHNMIDSWVSSISVTKNIGSNADSMQDSDWGINFYENTGNGFSRDSLDIYSESQLTVELIDVDVSLKKKLTAAFLPGTQLLVGGGILVQRYQFETFNTIQYYPSEPLRAADLLKGKTLTYRYESIMPYIATGIIHPLSSQLNALLSLSYSPILLVKDFDNHIMRSKKQTGESNGWGTKLNAALAYNLNSSIAIHIRVSYLNTVANGIQTQVDTKIGDSSKVDIGLRNITKQADGSFGITYVF